MKLSSIPQLYRNLRRWTEIVSVLSKYGLADWISRLNLEFAKDQFKAEAGEAIARQPHEARIRLALSDLGPTFIKLGQLLSTRADLVGTELANELKKLQAEVRADPPEKVRQIIETELGEGVDSLFAEFEDEPIASASIGQVHKARLFTGERVVVKVREDLDVLMGVAQLAENVPEFAPYRPMASAAEMARTLRRELDFGREERNLLTFASLFETDETVHIPHPFTDYCTARVLTMEYVEGCKLADSERLDALGYDRELLARRGAEVFLKMIFKHGYFHADPHPGNIVVLPNNVIGLLDFGMTGRLDERLREEIEEMLMAIVRQDTSQLMSVIMRLGKTPLTLDEGAFSNDLADFVSHYSNQPLEKFDLSGALNEMMEMIRRYQIELPAQVVLLIKALVTLEGSGKLLSPRFSLMEVMQPFQKQMMLSRLSPRRQMRKFRRFYQELEHLAEVLPRRIMAISEQIQSGRFDVHLDHRGLGPSVNRLVLGMVSSALFLGSSLMLSMKVPPLLLPGEGYFGVRDLSLFGLAGIITSVMMGLRLIRSIYKTGHLDHKDKP